MIKPQVTFPVAEGVGIFVGIVAWDLLTDGRVDIAKALLIAAPCAIAWFGIQTYLASMVLDVMLITLFPGLQSLKEQVVLNWVKLRNAERICNN